MESKTEKPSGVAKPVALAAFIVIALMLSSSPAFAYEDEDLMICPGIEAEDLIIFCTSILAFALFFITAMAYKRDRRRKFIYVTIAFFLFAVKGFLDISEIIFLEESIWLDLTVSLLDFAILASFFLGILEK